MMIEQWIVVNQTAKSFSTGIIGTPPLTKFSSCDLLLYANKDDICSSVRLRTLIYNGQVVVRKIKNGITTVVNASNVDTSFCEIPAPIPPITPGTPATFKDLEKKADKVLAAVANNLVSLNSTGNILDSGKKPADFATAMHGHDVSSIQGLQTSLDGKASESDFTTHQQDHDNPHGVTSSQIGAYSKEEIDSSLAGKADEEHCHNISDIVGLADALVEIPDAVNGASGYSGYSGQNGVIGIDGASGYSGYSGQNGTSGYSGYSGTTNIYLGSPSDGEYTGLLSFTPDLTLISDAVDQMNDVLKQLAPSPANNFSDFSCTQSGVTGNLSYSNTQQISGVSWVLEQGNLTDINEDQSFVLAALGGKRRGIFSASTGTFSGILASNVLSAGTGSPTPAWPIYSFADGDKGFLKLYVNDDVTPKVIVDLTILSSQIVTLGECTLSISAATSVKFPNGISFDIFKYRTGTWSTTGSSLREGWNFARVVHSVVSGNRPSTLVYIDFIRDLYTTSIVWSSESLVSWSPIDTNKYISGVHYYTGGTGKYTIYFDNAYKNTYLPTGSITFGYNSTPLQAVAAMNLGACGGNENLQVQIASKTFTVITTNTRILNQPITVKTSLARTVQGTATSTGVSISNILLDNYIADSTITYENFNDEFYRIPSDVDFDNQSVIVTETWNSLNNILNSGPSGYNNGLMVYNGTIIYPQYNFSSYLNGPSGNVDYSTGVTGARQYYRYFSMAQARSNFTLTVTGTGTIRGNSYSITAGTNDIQIDIKLPNSGSEGTGWLDVTSIFSTAQWTDGKGCLQASSAPFALGSAENLTIGTKSTGSTTVNSKVIVRIRVPQGWTGNLASITLIGL